MRCYRETLNENSAYTKAKVLRILTKNTIYILKNEHSKILCFNERQKSYSVLPISHPTSVAPAASSTNAVGIKGMIL